MNPIFCNAKPEDVVVEGEVILFGKYPSRNLRCKTCGLLWRDPMPSDEALTEFYSHNHFRHEDDVQDQMAKQQAHFLQQHLPSSGSMRAIEYGAGNGYLLAELAKLPGVAEAIGLEPDEVSAQSARQKHGVDMRPGFIDDVPDLPAWQGTELIALSHVFEHLPRPVETLQKLQARHPHHYLFLEVPDGTSEAAAILSVKALASSLDQHLFSYTPAAFAELFSATGYEVVAQERIGKSDYFSNFIQRQKLANRVQVMLDQWKAQGQVDKSAVTDLSSLSIDAASIFGSEAASRMFGAPKTRLDYPSLRWLIRYGVA
ncbi:MAG: class I SAM-dependent methyltransferase [Fimbriimonadaceae bacterium]